MEICAILKAHQGASTVEFTSGARKGSWRVTVGYHVSPKQQL